MKRMFVFVLWLFPCSRLKNYFLNVLGNEIALSAKLHPNFVWSVEKFDIKDGAVVGPFNFFRNMKLVRLGLGAYFGKRNEVNSHPAFNRFYKDGGLLVLGDHSKVTNLHWLDCSAGIFIGRFSSVAGRNSLLMSHSVDLSTNAQRGRSIHISEYVFISVRCTLLGGACVPARSVIGAGSVVVGSLMNNGPGLLYGGVPAKRIKEMDGSWFSRPDGHTLDLVSIDGNDFWRNVI